MDQPRPNTLGFVGDGDELSFVIALESAFGFKLTQSDADQLTTVGGVHDLLVEKLQVGDGTKCATHMAFLRLRNGLEELRPDLRITPATDLREISRFSPKRVWKHLRKKAGLSLPPLATTTVFGVGFLLCLAGLIGLFVLGLLNVSQWWCAPLLATGVVMMCMAPGSFGDIRTVGDLAKRCASYNYAELVRLGARSSAAATWDALAEISSVCSESEISRGQINRETLIIHPAYSRLRNVDASLNS